MTTPTATEIKIHNFADNISTALRTCLTTNGLDDYFSIPSDQFQQAANSGEIVTALGSGFDWGQRPDTGAEVMIGYNFTTTVKLRSQRPADGPEQHDPSWSVRGGKPALLRGEVFHGSRLYPVCRLGISSGCHGDHLAGPAFNPANRMGVIDKTDFLKRQPS